MIGETLRLPAAMYADMVSLACRVAPSEAVGLVGFRGGSHEPASFVPLSNRSPNPRNTFFVMPHELHAAERSLAAIGCYAGAVFHSHPSSAAVPSAADLEHSGELMLICSLKPQPAIRAWDRSREVPIEVYQDMEAVA